MSDIEKSFTFLLENIPSWLQNAVGIEEKVASKQDDMQRVAVPVSAPMKKKTGSTESIGGNAMDFILEETTSTNLGLQNSFLAKRKRKPGSVISGHASGPAKYRSRTMIIVYYDSEVQKAFETMVRNIGTGRNLLRKAKMAARMEALAEMAGSDDSDEGEAEIEPSVAKLGYRRAGFPDSRSTRQMTPSHNQSGSNISDVIEAADKALEQAQCLCEKGAHQFLRDGDCRMELDGIRLHMDEVMKMSQGQVAKYEAKKEKKEKEPEPKQEQEQKQEQESMPFPMETSPEPKRIMPTHIPSKTLAIEVDDGEEDDYDIALPPIRLTSRA